MTHIKLGVGVALRVYGGTKHNRPAIVLRMLEFKGESYIYVALGTSKAPPADVSPPPVFIDRNDLAFTPLGLDTPTWFPAGKGAKLRSNDPSIHIVGICPPEVLVGVRTIYGFK